MARKVIRKITIGGVDLPLYSATPLIGTSVEVDSLAAFGDPSTTNIARGIAQYSELTVTCLDEGIAVPVEAGDVESVTLTVDFGDGDGADVSRTQSKDMNIVSVEAGGEVSVDGDRKATVVIKMMPVGGDVLAGAPAAS